MPTGSAGILDLVSEPGTCRCEAFEVEQDRSHRRSWAKSKQQRLVDDRLWELLEPLIPPRPPARGPGGQPPIAERAALEGILFVHNTGCRWRDLPPALGAGD